MASNVRDLPPEADWTDTNFTRDEFRKRIAASGKSQYDYWSLKFMVRRWNISMTSLATEIVKTHKNNPALKDVEISVLLNIPVRYVRIVAKRRGMVLPR